MSLVLLAALAAALLGASAAVILWLWRDVGAPPRVYLSERERQLSAFAWRKASERWSKQNRIKHGFYRRKR